MSYYGCPFVFTTLENYIIDNYGEESLIYIYDPFITDEYEQALNESMQIESPVTFRYDYSPRLYHPGSHPASHLHIGYNNDI